jgi:hypothetical protein
MNFEQELLVFISTLKDQIISFYDGPNLVNGEFISGQLIGINESDTTAEAIINFLINDVIYKRNMFFYKKSGVIRYNVIEKENEDENSNITTNSILTKLEFVNRFTPEEFKAIVLLSKTNSDIEYWYLKFNLATYIDTKDQNTIDGIRSLELAGLIAPGRGDEILE